MDDTQFELLLYEEESTTLDFKECQYRFVKGTDEDKSELLKDILGFCNAWRRSEAFILIGVKDVRGGRAEVVGIPEAEHLDDHSLQQFVSGLTNRPVRFHYEAFGFEGKQVGIIRIEQQPKPLCLKKKYGKLQKDEVYVRRGSSTDPTKPAGPDEIAQMGRASAPQRAELVVEFAEVDRDAALGTHITWNCEFCEMPPDESIPDLESPRWGGSSIGRVQVPMFLDPFNQSNRDYYRELAQYEFARRLFRPIRLIVKNIGDVAATSVRVELAVATSIDATLIEESDMPDPPRYRNHLHHISAGLTLQSALRRSPGDVSIAKNNDRFLVEIDCCDLQPGRQVHSDVLFVGKKTSGDISLHGKVFADNLPVPKDLLLAIGIAVNRTSLSVDELMQLPDSASD